LIDILAFTYLEVCGCTVVGFFNFEVPAVSSIGLVLGRVVLGFIGVF
jgi:hypothetical protein